MIKDINSLTGLEFENLCQEMLQKSGFSVETTKQSGDGGIDLIAYNYQPFYSGKYIIQCKRYSGSVGEPIVRDLYGVVMAEHANKGILITTGHFTVNASRFAQNKNLELIDGEALATIFTECGMVEQRGPLQLSHFTQHQCFDKQKYEFYKNMIAQNMCSIEMGQDFLFKFMFDYFLNAHKTDVMNDMIHCGFAEEYLKVFDWYAGKYYKRGKDKLYILNEYVRQYKGLAQIYHLDLFEYVQNRYKILTQDPAEPRYCIHYRADNEYYRDGRKNYSLFFLREWDIERYRGRKNYILQNLDNADRVEFSGFLDFDEVMNLLSLFHYFGIQAGIDHINKMLFGRFPELGEWIQSQTIYKNAINSFIISYKKSEGKKCETDYCVDVSAYFNRFKTVDKDKIALEIEKINSLLSSL